MATTSTLCISFFAYFLVIHLYGLSLISVVHPFAEACLKTERMSSNVLNILNRKNKECPSPFKQRGNFLCVFVNKQMQSFYSARETCHLKGGFLAEPLDRDEIPYISVVLRIAAKESGMKSILQSKIGTLVKDDLDFFDESETLLEKHLEHYEGKSSVDRYRFWIGGSYITALLDWKCEELENRPPFWHTNHQIVKNWVEVPNNTDCNQCIILDLARGGLVGTLCSHHYPSICEYNNLHIHIV